MQDAFVRAFRRGFLYHRERPRALPPSYAASEALPGLWLCREGSTRERVEAGTALVIQGVAVPTVDDGRASIDALFDALREDEDRFLDALGGQAGRFAAFWRRNGGPLRATCDATCSRPLFYATGGDVLASHARLTAENAETPGDKIGLSLTRGAPGLSTPWPGIKVLTPNAVFDFETWRPRRVWPLGPLAPRTPEEAAAQILDLGATALAGMYRQRPEMALGLTGGVDSRFSLALAKRAGVPIHSYTTLRNEGQRADAKAAQKIAAAVGVTHEVLRFASETRDPGMEAAMRAASYFPGGAAAMVRAFGASPPAWDVFLSSNYLEIGRAFFRDDDMASPTAGAEAYLAKIAKDRKIDRGRIVPEMVAWAERAFAEFYEVTQFDAGAAHIPSADLYYWEHRMPAWVSQLFLARDLVEEVLVPFNARDIYACLLGLPYEARRAGTAVKLAIADALPELEGVRFV